MNELTEAQQIAKHYSACLDSVHLIQNGKPDGMEDSEWQDCLARNKEHLVIQLTKADMYVGYDLKPLEDASK
jgi:hypothetical protein